MTALAARTTGGSSSGAAAAPVSVIGEPRLLAGLDSVGRIDARAHGAVHGSLPEISRDQLHRWTAEVALLGRGGAAFPVSRKLESMPRSGASAVVVNGSESEPASHKDRVLMRRSPHLVLDGLRVVARALGARDLAITVHDRASADSLQHALGERSDLVGTRIVHTRAGFVAGEAQAAIAGLDGARPVPPGRKTLPTVRGLGQRPTFLSNVETFAQLAVLARTGPAAFARTGSSVEPGTRLFTVGGAVGRPGVVEAPSGCSLDIMLASAHASPATGVLLGGYHGSWLAPGPLALDAPSVRASGFSLGAGVVLVMDDSSCPLGEVARVTRWLADESAGQCGPCFFGLPALAADVEGILRGVPGSAENANRHLGLLPGRGACSHPDGTARFVRSALRHFRSDLSLHLTGRGCGRPVLGVLPLGVAA
ncbi:MAG: hypothetical protein JWM76_856 [Pseudonocardiales bacterium]|nr:hypothetical protein [Pseudonocardiales bacterium]